MAKEQVLDDLMFGIVSLLHARDFAEQGNVEAAKQMVTTFEKHLDSMAGACGFGEDELEAWSPGSVGAVELWRREIRHSPQHLIFETELGAMLLKVVARHCGCP